MVVMIKLGDDFPLINMGKAKGQDTVMLEPLVSEDPDDVMGFALVFYLSDMSREESDIISSAEIETRAYVEDNFVAPVLLFKGTPLMFQLTYDPFLYTDERVTRLEYVNITHIFAVDSDTNIVKGLRMANLPVALRDLWLSKWAKAKNNPDYSEEYREWTSNLNNAIPLDVLWARSTPTGSFGDK
jgi:hypothetical protein